MIQKLYIKHNLSIAFFSFLVTLLTGSPVNANEAAVSSQLDTAFKSLKDGRSFRKGVKALTQGELIKRFQEGLNDSKGTGTILAVKNLKDAINIALRIRNGDDANARLQNKGGRRASDLAGTIVNEALEAELFGYLALGNRDLINGTRLQFPGASEANDQYSKSPPTQHVDPEMDLRRRIYKGDSRRELRSLEYARLYFLEGIISALDVLRRDVEPGLRTVDTTSSYPAGWTKWNQHGNGSKEDNGDPSVTLPGFVDANFNQVDDQWSLTAGIQLGKIIRRYGGTVVTIGDKLWRKAFQHGDNSSVMVGKDQPTSEDYSQEGIAQLRCGMHTQYLSSLPLAAVLNDGSNGRANEYQEAGLVDISTSIENGSILMSKILSKTRPFENRIVQEWNSDAIKRKIQDVKSALDDARQAWTIVLQKRAESGSQDTAIVSEKRLLRSNYQYKLWEISGIHPDEIKDPNGGSDPLDTLSERQAYYQAVVDKARELMNTYDPASAIFNNSINPNDFPDPLDGITATVDGNEIKIGTYVPNTSKLAFAALDYAYNIQSLKNLLKRLSNIDKQIAIIEGKTGKINQLNESRAEALGAIDAMIAIASTMQIGIKEKFFSPGEVVRSTQALVTRTISALTDSNIRDAETDAAVANMLIEKEHLDLEVPKIKIGIERSTLQVQSLLGETSQLLAEYAFNIDVLPDDLQAWYYDPEIRFAKKAAEERYEQLVRVLQQEAYILTKHLETAWLEDYEFPALDNNGVYKTYTTDVDGASEFPDSESVFNGLDYTRVETYLSIVRRWDGFLRENRRDGPSDINNTENPLIHERTISMRKHLFQLPDYKWDENLGRYIFSEELENISIRDFRARMAEAVKKGRTLGQALRVEFDLNVAKMHEVNGRGTIPVFSNYDESPDEWNRRIVRIGVKFIGQNVSQGDFTNSGIVGGRIALHGSVYRQKGNTKSAKYLPARAEVTDLTRLQADPDSPNANTTLFSTNIPIVVGSRQLSLTDSQIARHLQEWPFNCNMWILTSRAQANYDNLTDIQIKIGYIWGHPEEFNLDL